MSASSITVTRASDDPSHVVVAFRDSRDREVQVTLDGVDPGRNDDVMVLRFAADLVTNGGGTIESMVSRTTGT